MEIWYGIWQIFFCFPILRNEKKKARLSQIFWTTTTKVFFTILITWVPDVWLRVLIIDHLCQHRTVYRGDISPSWTISISNHYGSQNVYKISQLLKKKKKKYQFSFLWSNINIRQCNCELCNNLLMILLITFLIRS